MEQPTYVRRLLNQKVLLIIGFVVALIAGLLAGFTYEDGKIEPRAVRTYSAASTILLTSPVPDYFQTEIPGTTQALPQTETPEQAPQELIVQEATPIDLADSAIILAYMASSDVIADAVADAVDGFEEGDGLTAVRRTTQPAGDERFGGRLTLPIIDIVGTSTSPARAELIAAEATNAFAALVEEQQIEWGVAEDIRLVLDELNAPVADTGEGSNPAIPVIVVTAGVFLLFIALALIIEAVRDGRRRSRAGSDETGAEESGADESGTDESGADESDAATHGDDERADAPVVAPEGDRVLVHGRAAGMRRGSRRSRTLADDPELTDPELVDTQLVDTQLVDTQLVDTDSRADASRP